ncbi:MAG: COX15/CtaA family protein [Chitinophagaceae bacterium]
MQTNAGTSSSRAVANWIMLGVFMLLVQVILGGITRLTGSGLSITEWDVVTGAIPPLNEQRWMEEFEKYKTTPQFQIINRDFTLGDFKFIFFWEWFHRFWGRLIGIAFAIPFFVFLIQRKIRKEMIRPLVLLFLFGALQGVIGWVMVKSGLTGDAVYVKPTKLALHFVFALGLIACTFWFGLQLMVPPQQISSHPPLRKFTGWLIAIVFVQLIFGALMAGHKAATAAPTWPTINGDWFPASLFRESPFLFNFIDNTITIHFVHRMLAYLLAILVVIWTIKATPRTPLFRKTRWIPLLLVIIQVLLGIASLFASSKIVPGHWGTFEWLAQLHQVTGMLFVLSLVAMYFLLTGNSISNRRRNALI